VVPKETVKSMLFQCCISGVTLVALLRREEGKQQDQLLDRQLMNC
jgi:hypothetical protein